MASPRRYSNLDLHIRILNNQGIVRTLFGGVSKLGIPQKSEEILESECRRKPQGFAIDKKGNIFLSDSLRHVIIMVPPTGTPLRTVAGGGGKGGDTTLHGHRDGKGDLSFFHEPRGLAVSPDGSIYVADSENHVIRRLIIP